MADLCCPSCERKPDDDWRRENESEAKRDYLDAKGELRCGECQVPYVEKENPHALTNYRALQGGEKDA